MPRRARSACLVVLVLAACSGGFAAKARQSIAYAFAATTAAQGEFLKWDRAHQQSLVAGAASREDGEARLAAYRGKREKVVRAFTVSYTALAAAAALVPFVERGQKPEGDLVLLISDVARAAVEVKVAIDALRGEPP